MKKSNIHASWRMSLVLLKVRHHLATATHIPETFPPFWVEHPVLKIKFELEDLKDLYENCIIEILQARDESMPPPNSLVL